MNNKNNHRSTGFGIALAITVAGLCVQAHGDVVLDEATLGDFSDNGLAPSHFSLGAGTTIIAGTFGATSVAGRHDLDYVSITVPVGHVLSRFVLVDANVGGAFSFVGIQAGPAVTVEPDNWSIETPLLGWAHFGSSSAGRDLLPEMAVSPGSVGFTAPLPAGTYSMWIMELDTSDAYRYRFGLEVVAIPGPGVLAGMAILVCCLPGPASIRRRGR